MEPIRETVRSYRDTMIPVSMASRQKGQKGDVS